MKIVALDVQGMSCGSCIAKVTDSLNVLPRVDGVGVHLATGRARVHGNFHQGSDPLLSTLRQSRYPARLADSDVLSGQSADGSRRRGYCG